MISYSANIKNGCYGIERYNSSKGCYVFEKKGILLKLEEVLKNVENGEVRFCLSFDYLGEQQKITLPRSALLDTTQLNPLVSIGVDISPKTKDIFVDSLRLQEHLYGINGNNINPIFENLGWLSLKNVSTPCFRSLSLIGDTGDYVGDFKISPMGSFDVWRDMILHDVIGDIIAEITLLASLSSVLIVPISEVIDIGNSILHLYGISGSGKSTDAMLAASVAGEPFEGDRRVQDSNGDYKTERSIYRSWGATQNALISSCAGNNGYPIVLNELGKCIEKDLTTAVYNLSEGTDKLRMTKDMNCKQSESFHTTIISVGEHSLIERCKDKADGLHIRVLELETERTLYGAERADRIKKVCKENNGHALPMITEYIIDNDKYDYVKEKYIEIYSALLNRWIKYDNYERFVAKFAALYLTTAEIAKEALAIQFSTIEIEEYILEHDKKNHKKRNSSMSAFEVLIETFLSNQNHFIEGNRIPNGECWGKIETPMLKDPSGKVVVKRYLVFKNILEKLLQENGYKNINTCVKAWKSEGLLDFEEGHSTRKRRIYPESKEQSRVYVFNVYEEFPAKEKRKVKSKIVELLKEEKEDDGLADTE